MKTTSIIDGAAVTLSTLCIVHCLLLPAMAISFPVFGALSDIEWLHKTFVVLALSVSINLIISRFAVWIRGLALVGITILLTAAFYEPLHDYETALTVMGAILLAGAHLFRMNLTRHSH